MRYLFPETRFVRLVLATAMLGLAFSATQAFALGQQAVPLGSWIQPDANGPAFRVAAIKGDEGAGGPKEWIELRCAVRNPTPRIYQWFNSDSLKWKVLDAGGHNIAKSQTMTFPATGEKDQAFRLYPGQRLLFTYRIYLSGESVPAALVSDFGGITNRISFTADQLSGKGAVSRFPEPRGTQQMEGVDAQLNKFLHVFQANQTDLEFLVSKVEGLDPMPGQGGAGGTRIVRVFLSARNATGKAWRYFNRSTLDLVLVDANEQTVSRAFEMFESDGKPAESYSFEPSEKRDFRFDIPIATSARPVKLMVVSESRALRYQLGGGPDAKTSTPTAPETTGNTPKKGSSDGSAKPDGSRQVARGRYALNLNGVMSGFPLSAEGGDISADVIEEKAGATDTSIRKRPGHVKYTNITIKMGLDMSGAVYDWISGSWGPSFQRKDGSVVTLDERGTAISERQFTQGLITETSIPACDSAKVSPGYITVKVTPEKTSTAPAPKSLKGNVAAAIGSGKQKQFTPHNFRLSIDGLDCSKIFKIDGLTVKRIIDEEQAGADKAAIKVPGRVEYPNLLVTLDGGSAKTWTDWFQDFIVKGNNGESKEKNGSLVFLDANLQGELLRVNFYNVGILGLKPSEPDPESGAVARFTAVLYCERMELKVPSK